MLRTIMRKSVTVNRVCMLLHISAVMNLDLIE